MLQRLSTGRTKDGGIEFAEQSTLVQTYIDYPKVLDPTKQEAHREARAYA